MMIVKQIALALLLTFVCQVGACRSTIPTNGDLGSNGEELTQPGSQPQVENSSGQPQGGEVTDPEESEIEGSIDPNLPPEIVAILEKQLRDEQLTEYEVQQLAAYAEQHKPEPGGGAPIGGSGGGIGTTAAVGL